MLCVDNSSKQQAHVQYYSQLIHLVSSLREYLQVMAIIAGTAILSMGKKVSSMMYYCLKRASNLTMAQELIYT